MRSWILAGALCTMALGQTPTPPARVIDTGTYDLGWDFSLFLTPEGRVLAHAPAGEPGAPPQVGIWEGSTAIPVRLDLPPFDPESIGTIVGRGCGGGGFLSSGPSIEPNEPPPGWDPTQRCFALRTRSSVEQLRLNEHGDELRFTGAGASTARVEVQGFTELRVTRPDGGAETHRRSMAEIPVLVGMSGIEKHFTRMMGFRSVLVSRGGEWVAATWVAAKRNLPNRLMPWIPDGPLRFLLFHAGDLHPVVDLPLLALTGDPSGAVSMHLSPQGTRIILQTRDRVVVLDPHGGEVILNRAGILLHLTTQSDELIQAQGPDRRALTKYDLRDGRATGTLTLPPSLDPPSAPADPERDTPDPSAPRDLTALLAFSPDGRWAIAAQCRRETQGWDALVLWEFQTP